METVLSSPELKIPAICASKNVIRSSSVFLALDILGAASQQFDAVAVWPPLADEATTDLVGVLRRCNSPVRMIAVTASTPAEVSRAGRLAGVAAVEDTGRPAELIATLETVVASPQTVGAIVAARRVPSTISSAWALAIYGAPPGSRLHAALD